MALQLQKIFLSSVQSNQRKFATKLLKHLVKDYPILISPNCGQFGLVKCAIEAGYRPENIYASDISLFSSLLGYYYAGKSIWDIDFILKDKYFEKFAEQARKIAKRENIVNMAAIFSKMLDYVGEVIKLKEDIDKAEAKKNSKEE